MLKGFITFWLVSLFLLVAGPYEVFGFRVLRPSSLDAIPPTSDPPFVHWDLREFPNCEIPYQINEDGTVDIAPGAAPNEFDAIDSAFESWELVVPALIGFTNQGPTSISQVSDADNSNVLFWDNNLFDGDPWDGGLIDGGVGLTYIFVDDPSGVTDEVDIVFDDVQFTWTVGTQNYPPGDDRYDWDPIKSESVIVDGGNEVSETLALNDDDQVVAPGNPVAAGGIVVRPGLDGVLDTVPNNTGTLDVQSIAAHEIGHFCGLGDIGYPDDSVACSILNGPFLFFGGELLDLIIFTVPNSTFVRVGPFPSGNLSPARVQGIIQAALDAQIGAGNAVVSVTPAGGIRIVSYVGDIAITGGLAARVLGFNGYSAPTMKQWGRGNPSRSRTTLQDRTLERDDWDGLNFLYTPDLGDAPDPFVPETTREDCLICHYNFYPSLVQIGEGRNLNGVQLYEPGKGAQHIFGIKPRLDYLYEWLGENVNPECESRQVNADVPFDDGLEFKYRPGFMGLPGFIEIKVTVGTAADADGGTHNYNPGAGGRNLYLNVWIDWDEDGNWDEAREHVVGQVPDTEIVNPVTVGTPLVRKYTVPIPPDAEDILWVRARLDWGEDCGDATGVPPIDPTLAKTRGAAQFGEVEDYVIIPGVFKRCMPDFSEYQDKWYLTLGQQPYWHFNVPTSIANSLYWLSSRYNLPRLRQHEVDGIWKNWPSDKEMIEDIALKLGFTEDPLTDEWYYPCDGERCCGIPYPEMHYAINTAKDLYLGERAINLHIKKRFTDLTWGPYNESKWGWPLQAIENSLDWDWVMMEIAKCEDVELVLMYLFQEDDIWYIHGMHNVTIGEGSGRMVTLAGFGEQFEDLNGNALYSDGEPFEDFVDPVSGTPLNPGIYDSDIAWIHDPGRDKGDRVIEKYYFGKLYVVRDDAYRIGDVTILGQHMKELVDYKPGLRTIIVGAISESPCDPDPRIHMHAEGGLIDLANPLDTWWHELHPEFCCIHEPFDWRDNGDGLLSPCDHIDMVPHPIIWPIETREYHVDDVTVTIKVLKKPDLVESMYLEFEAGFGHMDSALMNPVCTQWKEVYPVYCNSYHLSGWEDNGDGTLSYCDQIMIQNKRTGESAWYHVEEVATDIILSREEVEIGDVYIADEEGNRRTRVYPGEAVQFHIGYDVTGNPETQYKVKAIINAFGKRYSKAEYIYPGTCRHLIKDKKQGKRIRVEASPGTVETISYIIKLKDGDVLRDKDKATSQVTVVGPDIKIVNTYTSDHSMLPKTQFEPGDTVFYHIFYNVTGIEGVNHTVKGMAKNKGFNLLRGLPEGTWLYPDPPKHLVPPGSNYHMIIEDAVPDIAHPGQYWFKSKVKMKKDGKLLDSDMKSCSFYVIE